MFFVKKSCINYIHSNPRGSSIWKASNKLVFFLLTFAISGCIEPYRPKDISETVDTYVVFGQITSIPGYHKVSVSKSSPIVNPKFIPVSNCIVKITDTESNVFVCDSEGENGEYPIWIGEEYLSIGKGFKVSVHTPEGIEIESEFDYLKPCPEIANIYYERVDIPTTDPLYFEKGIQFMIDLQANDSFDRFFRWEVEETYEYRASYPIRYYYIGWMVWLPQPDYSRFYCWATNPILNIYTLSTKGLQENRFKGYKLHFVDNHTQRLMYMYSLKVTQHALSESYFNYLEQLRVNSSEQGGMFDTQPISITGNLYSPNTPNLKILGFFGASSVKSTRVFFTNIENLRFDLYNKCTLYLVDYTLDIFTPDEYPVYFLRQDGKLWWANQDCFDCTMAGGTTEKPPFWP